MEERKRSYGGFAGSLEIAFSGALIQESQLRGGLLMEACAYRSKGEERARGGGGQEV